LTETAEILKTVKEYILREFLPGESPEALTELTPLVTGGILDSLATLKLVDFLEKQFAITLEAHEVDAEHLDTLILIAKLVQSKQAG
jgi:acyl carrier protein